ncbi:pentatricopeptide repeat-containing protein At3g18970-like isoform X2 [Glycine soja]|uniref:Pentacotripeptide-repeat region of PRORP domain-containing protein n=2 Tax=Glycine subgen. Soja TaxID=1462606 RepID=A0A0R0HJS6_SOYBN|nr:pentatricopeptide repeat-containing protein At3g18970 isoform X2 [Glycine max]XP_028193604.1 pentatricopeptide repeat-containing protein At3g18970-like isoform X2 [Glycine soja]RZB76570.1 Pentatricopeptide repeat-containing protein isoform B [Glycine soja]|eukprot:XP_006592781.1 pentatricopeptide repeat-containing protein At3g18970 isoform X2 [Glycine max]
MKVRHKTLKHQNQDIIYLMLNCLPRFRCISFLYSLPKLSYNIKQIHAQLITNGLKYPTFWAKLIEHYCGSPDQHIANNARLVFQYFDKPDLFLFNTLIRCVQPNDSILIFRNEFSRGLMFFDEYTYNFVLGACARSPSASTLWVGRQLHALIVKHGVESNIVVPTTKVYFYASNKDIISSRKVFDEMPRRSTVTWNAMITVSQIGMLETGACIHGFAEKTVCTPEDDVFIGTGLVDMYSKCGCLDSALSVFWRMNQKNIMTWTAMTTGLAIHGKGKQSLEVLYKMGAYGVKPNEATFTSFLSACCHGGLVEEGLQLFLEMKRTFGVMPQIQHYGCIVDLLGRAGKLEEAYDFIMQMPINPDAVIWRSLLAACNIHGDVVMGEKVGKFLLQLEEWSSAESPKSEDYIALSNVYALAEKWDDVETVRIKMKAKSILNKAGSSAVQTVSMAVL